MILTPDEYQEKIEPRLSQSKKIRIVSAWVTKNFFLDCLIAERERSHLKIEVIAGTKNNISDPDAFEQILGLGEGKLRIGDRLTTRTYHPKVYIFENETSSIMWIGSANFTIGGFPGTSCRGNYEVLYEVESEGKLNTWSNWYSDLWESCEPATEEWIEKYRKERKRNPPKTSSKTAIGEPSPLELIDFQHLSKILDVMKNKNASKVKIGNSRDGSFRKGLKGAKPNYQIIRSTNGEEIAVLGANHKKHQKKDRYEEANLTGPFSISDIQHSIRNLQLDSNS